ncbi:hypothetical protein QVG61_03860 [Thiohalobacter sp. IOR34]|uniref:hypothetical protein n=1 Tax=Thiohalobacter sp. IOR34 TaxID=3057176 RepID=UPI0025B25DA9|nr:hypothetical protein [Thiohalobacter sp. IOR34]WJW76239.1 hypothetical protein QVG61_03860 [Thiohalobacter sp. IOR34]
MRGGRLMKKYGIRGWLPEDDPMRAAHLLGEHWEWVRWYRDEAERDLAYEAMMRHFEFHRPGDRPSQVLEKIEAEVEEGG